MLCTRCMVCSPEMTDKRRHRAGHKAGSESARRRGEKRPSGTSRLGLARQPWRLQQPLRPGLRRGRRTRRSPGQEMRGIPQSSCTKEGVEIRRKAPTLFGNSVGSEHLAAPVFLRLSRITASPIEIDGEDLTGGFTRRPPVEVVACSWLAMSVPVERDVATGRERDHERLNAPTLCREAIEEESRQEGRGNDTSCRHTSSVLFRDAR